MKFGVPWSVKGIRPEARESAKEAARRSGLPLGEWLNSVIINSAAQAGVEPGFDDDDTDELSDVHGRLDDITRRLDRLGRSGPDAYAPKRTRDNSDQLVELIGRLDQRIDQLAAAVHTKAPPLAPSVHSSLGIDQAVAEISARRRMLNGEQPAPPIPAAVRPQAQRAAVPTQDLSGLEDQLRNITEQIETLRRPGVEDAINALRGELNDIGRALIDAMPQRAIETIEQQIKGLSHRIAEGRQAGVDASGLTGVEQGLAEVRDALRNLTPAESLVGFNDAVAGLANKIDLVVAHNDPAMIQQLESSITTLRELSSHVATNETVSKLAGYVQTLAQRVEEMAHTGATTSAIGHLEQRITALSDALTERTQHGGTVPPRLEVLVTSLSDKIEQIQNSRGDNVALGHLEDRIVTLVQRLDASDSRLVHLEAIERGLADLLVHIEDIRGNRSGGLRADTLHDTANQSVRRLAAAAQNVSADFRTTDPDAIPLAQPVGKVVARAVADTPPPMPQVPTVPPMQVPQVQVPPATQMIQGMRAPQATQAPQATAQKRAPMPGVKRPAIDPDLPPDQPIEPGSMPPRATADLAARIAASEAALGGVKPTAETGERSSFIFAARRAAKAAADEQPLHADAMGEGQEHGPSLGSKIAKRVKSLFVAASVIAIVIGSLQIGSKFFDFGRSAQRQQSAHNAAKNKARDDAPASTGSIASDSVAAPGTAMLFPSATPFAGNIATTPTLNLTSPQSTLDTPPPNASQTPASDITGSIPRPMLSSRPIVPPIPMLPAVSGYSGGLDDKLPAAIGGATLRTAAAAGNPAATYEVALRYAEGHGVASNLEEAARWFERAASKGLAPAQFRLGSMLEKGQGVKKDLARARNLYLAAAAKGNAKAMHNLAVLYAEGTGGKPDYATAVSWFRKAANRGISDSQYNLAILYARGMGVEKSFSESYKWFALAAEKGDRESAKKRDEIAARLDPKTLAAAQHAVKIWTAEPQPEAANTVAPPPGGWDHEKAGTPAAKSKPRSPGTYEIGKR